MTRAAGLVLAFWLALAGHCRAAEHAACHDPSHEWYTLSPEALRGIAASCTSASFAELNYQRAYMRDLLGEDAAVSGLISWTTLERAPRMEAHGVHMLLLEQLSPLYFASVTERVAFLNAEYEIRNEIAELWLRGYGTLATRLSDRHSRNEAAR